MVPHENSPKTGQHYVDALRARFGAAILNEEWRTPDQVAVTVDLNTLPDVVENLYYQQGGWLSTVVGNDERSLNGNFAVYYVLSMEDTVKSWVIVKALV